MRSPWEGGLCSSLASGVISSLIALLNLSKNLWSCSSKDSRFHLLISAMSTSLPFVYRQSATDILIWLPCLYYTLIINTWNDSAWDSEDKVRYQLSDLVRDAYPPPDTDFAQSSLGSVRHLVVKYKIYLFTNFRGLARDHFYGSFTISIPGYWYGCISSLAYPDS